MSLTTVDSGLISSGAITLTTQVTGTLPEANGGTGTTVGYCGFKNRIINGGMVIDQRNAGASVTSTGTTYTVDRWQGQGTVDTSKFSVQQSTSVVPPNFTVSAKITSLSAYSPTTAAIQSFKQVIEVGNIADNGWGTSSAVPMTLGFWVRSSVTGTFSGAVTRADSSTVVRSFVFTYEISSANTWEYKTAVISADTDSTYVYVTTQSNEGAQVRFDLGSSSTKLSSTVGSWQTGNYFGATSATKLLATNGATFYITGVQLERGSTATSFDYRPYGTELALCQRYYQQYNSTGDNAGFICNGYNDTTTRSFATIQFPVIMRTSPSLAIVSATSFGVYGVPANSLALTGITLLGSASLPSSIGLILTVSSGLTAGQGTVLKDVGANANGRIQLSAEL